MARGGRDEARDEEKTQVTDRDRGAHGRGGAHPGAAFGLPAGAAGAGAAFGVPHGTGDEETVDAVLGTGGIDPGLLPYDCSRCRNGACLKRSDCLRWLAGISEIGRTPIILCDGDGTDCRYFIPPLNPGD